MRDSHDCTSTPRTYLSRAVTTYAVKWREPDGGTFVGRLVLGPRNLRLDGRTTGADGPSVKRQFDYDELRGLQIGSRTDRLDGRPAIVVDRADGRYLVADAGMGIPIVHELVERLAELRDSAPRKATVVVPLKPGATGRVRELVAKGPPFDPGETPLIRHDVLLTPEEAIFVLESDTEEGLRTLLAGLDILSAAAVWGELVAGPPRLAELAYAWERSEPHALAVRR